MRVPCQALQRAQRTRPLACAHAQSGPTAQEWEALEAAAAALAAARPPGHAQGHPPAATAGTGASPFASPLGHQDRASHSHPPAAAGHHQHNGGPPAHPHVQASLQYYASQPGMSAQAQAGGLELQVTALPGSLFPLSCLLSAVARAILAAGVALAAFARPWLELRVPAGGDAGARETWQPGCC